MIALQLSRWRAWKTVSKPDLNVYCKRTNSFQTTQIDHEKDEEERNCRKTYQWHRTDNETFAHAEYSSNIVSLARSRKKNR